MIQTKSNLIKQAALCAWIGLTVYVWVALNVSAEFLVNYRVPEMISRYVIASRELVYPYVFRQYIFAEKNKKEEGR